MKSGEPMLIEETMFGVRDKVADALKFLRDFVPEEGFYLAYSGGKDSTVLLDLAKRSGVKFDAHYNHTTVDPPELVRFIRQQPKVVSEYPDKSMWDLIIENGVPPTKIMRYCCRLLKERGGSDRKVLTGVRRAESARRSKRQQVETCFKDGSRQYFHPIFHWSEAEVWEYIHKNNVPYCSLYDEGFKRLGCICCPMKGGKKQIEDGNRWPKYKDQYISTFEKMIKNRLLNGKETEWENGQEVWDWWVKDREKSNENEDQIMIFE